MAGLERVRHRLTVESAVEGGSHARVEVRRLRQRLRAELRSEEPRKALLDEDRALAIGVPALLELEAEIRVQRALREDVRRSRQEVGEEGVLVAEDPNAQNVDLWSSEVIVVVRVEDELGSGVK